MKPRIRKTYERSLKKQYKIGDTVYCWTWETRFKSENDVDVSWWKEKIFHKGIICSGKRSGEYQVILLPKGKIGNFPSKNLMDRRAVLTEKIKVKINE